MSGSQGRCRDHGRSHFPSRQPTAARLAALHRRATPPHTQLQGQPDHRGSVQQSTVHHAFRNHRFVGVPIIRVAIAADAEVVISGVTVDVPVVGLDAVPATVSTRSTTRTVSNSATAVHHWTVSYSAADPTARQTLRHRKRRCPVHLVPRAPGQRTAVEHRWAIGHIGSSVWSGQRARTSALTVSSPAFSNVSVSATD